MIRPRRALALVASLFALAFLAAPVARAADDDASQYYDRFAMALADAAMTEGSGWKLVHDASKGAADRQAIADAVAEAAKEAKLEPKDAEPLLQSIEIPEGKIATVALVDVRTKAAGYTAALKARAEKAKWAFREMGSPSRLLVVSAPEDLKDQVVATQTRFAGRLLAIKAWGGLEAHLGNRAVPLAKAAISIEPGAALAHFVLGMASLADAQREGTAAAYDPAIASLRAASDEKAAVPVSGREMATARGELGGALLNKKTAAEDAEARDVLKKAVESAPVLERRIAFGYRYNLACAHGRLKELEPAFEHLKAVLEEDAKEPAIAHWRKDPDFDNLHADPRWAELLKKYGETGPAAGD